MTIFRKIYYIKIGINHPVVDGNVYRVLSRYLGIDTPIDSTEGKKMFSAVADELLDRKNPALYNQAIMDFGAIQCSPQTPNCMLYAKEQMAAAVYSPTPLRARTSG